MIFQYIFFPSWYPLNLCWDRDPLGMKTNPDVNYFEPIKKNN